MITVHVLTMPGDNDCWKEQVSKDLTHKKIIQQWENGINLNTGLARANAFRKASTPYVGFADPDDRTKTSAWLKCLDILENSPDVVMVSTGQAAVSKDLKRIERIDVSEYSKSKHLKEVQHVHGVIVMRTAPVLEICHRMEGLNNCAEWTLSLSLIPYGKIVKLPMIGRYWRQHEKQLHRRCTGIQKRRAFNAACIPT